ncbi:MAG TPA: hypothetical protein VGD19_02760 [Allosphingosinicella sp.]|jgi:hypothetical protein
MKNVRVLMVLAGVAALAACVPQRQAPPPPPSQPRPVVPARPAPPPPPVDWGDLPLSPGGWSYRSDGNGSQALFGPAGGEAAFAVRCDRAARQVVLARQGSSSRAPMTVRTSFAARAFPVVVDADPRPTLTARLAASDRFLDGIAFSRGRFTVETPGLPMLVIPAWPEPARVVEDCRG